MGSFGRMPPVLQIKVRKTQNVNLLEVQRRVHAVDMFGFNLIYWKKKNSLLLDHFKKIKPPIF